MLFINQQQQQKNEVSFPSSPPRMLASSTIEDWPHDFL